MNININNLIIWIIIGFAIATFSSILKGENIIEFFHRLTFVELFEIVSFLILTKIGFLK